MGLAIPPSSYPEDHSYLYAGVRTMKREYARMGVLLAVFGGTLGLHRLYLHDRRGWIHVLRCWTGLPTVVGLLEAFDIPRRVRIYNTSRAEADRLRLRWIDKLQDEK